MSWVHYKIGMPGEVILVPDAEIENFEDCSLNNRSRSKPLPLTKSGSKAGDGNSYRVPLGPPIIDVEVKDHETHSVRETLRACLNLWIELDYRNIRHYRMTVPYSEEAMGWKPNDPPSVPFKVLYYGNTGHDAGIKPIMLSIGPGISALMNSLRLQGQSEKLSRVKSFATLVREYDALDSFGLGFLDESSTEDR